MLVVIDRNRVMFRMLGILLFSSCWKVISSSENKWIKGPDVIWLEHDADNNGWVRKVKGDPEDYLQTKKLSTWSVKSPAWYWTAVDINYSDNLIYLFDRYDRYHVQLSLGGQLNILNYGSSSEVHGLAYDWLARNLYWTDSLYNWIQVMKPGTKYTRTLVDQGLDKPHGIAVHPQKGVMYWTDWGEKQKIQKANMDGTESVVLVTKDLNRPMGITIDYANNRLFWTCTHVIESYDLATGTRLRYVEESKSNFIGVAVYKEFLFATDLGMELPPKPQVWFLGFNKTHNSSVHLTLPRIPYGITVYANTRQKQSGSPCDVNSCAHMCVPLPSTYGLESKCLCQDGYNSTDKGKTCKPTVTSKGAMYVYALLDRICAVPIKRTMKKSDDDPKKYCFFNSASKAYKFRTVDFNYKAGEIYFSESGMGVKTIRRAQVENRGVNQVLVYGTGDVRGLVVDWMSSNMYWTDVDTAAIWVSRLEGHHMSKLIKDVYNPVAITVDMETRRLFWTESLGRVCKIMTANMDGTNRTKFVSNRTIVGNSAFTSLSVDYVTRRLYWVDPVTSKIWSASLTDGSDHQIQPLKSINGDIYGVTVMQDFVGVTENSANSGIHVLEKVSGEEIIKHGITHSDRTTAFDIVAYYGGNQRDYPGSPGSSCTGSNGGCEQLCFPARELRTCGCTDRMKLSKDGTSCEPSLPLLRENFFLIADNYHRQIYQTDEDIEHIRALKFPPLDRPIGLTYDFVTDRVFWADYNTRVVRSMKLDGSDVKLLIGETNKSRIEGLAFDSDSQLLYYTDAGLDLVAVMSTFEKYHKVLVRDIVNPRAIVLDTTKGYMYITSRKMDEGRILRYTMDGRNEEVLVSDLSWPSGLDIDFTNQIIYWCDSQSDLIETADIDGSNRRTVWKGISTSDQFDVVAHGGFIYWTDWSQKALFRILPDGTGRTKLGADLFLGLNDIKFFSKANSNETTACTGHNGQCSHFCIPLPGNKRTCECPDSDKGSVVLANGNNCPGVKTCSGNFPNATVKECSLRMGDVCHVTCPERYQPTVSQIICLGGLGWNADVNRLCTLKTCPDGIPNGSFDVKCSRHLDETCQYSCDTGYKKMIDGPLKCLENQTWEVNVTDVCISRRCPDKIRNGHFDIYCNRKIGRICRYYCKSGFSMVINRPLTCQKDLTWDVDTSSVCRRLVCPQLEIPNKAQLARVCPRMATVGVSCTFSCVPGTAQSDGDPKRTCLYDLSWSGTPLVCTSTFPIVKSSGGHELPSHKARRCPDKIRNGHFVIYCNRKIGRRCRYYCKAGFSMVINRPLMCQKDLTWDIDTSSVCRRLVCPPLEIPNKAQLARVCPRQATVGVSCTFACVPGTAQSDGNLKRTCLYDLSWSGTPLVCTSTLPIEKSTSGHELPSHKVARGGVDITAGNIGIILGTLFICLFISFS